jgi:acyl-CoA reductase-like NAD-dependent aldehyde dehydrogenase
MAELASAGAGTATSKATSPTELSGRLAVRKTYKLYIGGAFPRSESGRSYKVGSASGLFLANVAWASRKDVRDAVVAARKAQPGWAAATAYLRGQILYRAAEMLEGRRAQFAETVALSEGTAAGDAAAVVDAAVDRLVWYAGWSDKIAQVAGSSNSVAGPYFNFSVPEPTGVVGVLAPQASSLFGLVSVLAPVIVSGNAAVVLASESRPVPAVDLAEVLATSDLPGGVVNLLTGRTAELAPVLAAHRDVDALDLAGAPDGTDASLEEAASGNVKRVLRRRHPEPDWGADPGPARMLFFTETKTVWHPMGL